jgi:hypothetical protein
MTKQERDAWAVGYRIYDEYAPKLRQAALSDDNELANDIFYTISSRISASYNGSDKGGQLVLLGVYDILGNVFEEERKSKLIASA